MEQSIIMIPMYNPANGAHRAIVRIRISQGGAQVETRWSGFEDAEDLFLLTDQGAHFVSNGRAVLGDETLLGVASMNNKGECGCGGPVRGREADFERALVSLRIERQSKQVVKIVSQEEKAPPVEMPRVSEVYFDEALETEETSLPATPEEEAIPVMCSRAMDGYISQMDEPKSADRTAPIEDAVKIFIPAGAAPINVVDSEEIKSVSSHPDAEGEEPGWPVFMQRSAEREETRIDDGWSPANAPEDWAEMPAMNGAQSPVLEPSDALNETLTRASALFPPEEDRELPGMDTLESYPFVMPQRVANPFPKQFPGSSWVRIQRLQGQGYYLEGRMRRGSENMTITAAPGEYSPVPPKYLQGFSRFIQTKDGGFWVRMRRE